MMAFNLSWAARSRIAINSAFCSAVLSPFFEGQSMFATVATQAARNSLTGLGGMTFEGPYVAAGERHAVDISNRVADRFFIHGLIYVAIT